MSIAFQNQVVSITSMVGETLADVGYWILRADQDAFLVDQPNADGLAALRLRFGGGGLEITWNWDRALLTDGDAYHIHVTQSHEPQLAGLWNSETLSLIPATNAALWRGVIGETLSSVAVLGSDGSPQAIRFAFADVAIIVAIGYSGDVLLLGDGDELLIFSEGEWMALTSDGTQPWRRPWHQLWSASAPLLPAIPAKV